MEYKIYKSQLVPSNLPQFKSECKLIYDKINQQLNTSDSTWSYLNYNIFTLSATSILFYSLFKELNYHIRSYIGDNRPLWMQSWLNYHQYKEADKKLSYHGHQTEYHGYVCIDPQNTKTIFKKGFEILNTPGQIYLGPGSNNSSIDDYNHYVETLNSHTEPRITIGFNIGAKINNNVGGPSWIPII